MPSAREPKTLSVKQLLLLSVVSVGSVIAIAVSLLQRPPQHPRPSTTASAAVSVAPLVAPVVSTHAPAVSADPAETEIIERMQLALRTGDAPRALTVATEHERRFPSGALAEERESGRAIARCWRAQPEARPALLTAFLQ